MRRVSVQFHQHGDPSCKGFDHTGSHAWGHGRSPDLVRWTRMKNSGVCGSTSGGVTVVPGELQAHTGWRGAILVSAPSMKVKSTGVALIARLGPTL